MTIAIGAIARDGLVLAADTQESGGYWKHDQGKIYECGRGLLETPNGGAAFCLVSGAGHAHLVDVASLALTRRFCAEPFLTRPGGCPPSLGR
jgi:hypothetical protein